ncbi:MAG: hypothetical protein HOC71_00200, partial [Candidatus Latescibacteria bacterium]|nr:hypothetical protein [Candidatus Latescibacterota bacterium]
MRHLTVGLVLVLTIIFTANAFADKEWKSFKELNNVCDMAVQGDYIWWVTFDSVVRYNMLDNSFEDLTPPDIEYGKQNDIEVTPDGVVWVGTKKGIASYENGSWTYYTEEDGLTSTRVFMMEVAPDGALWIGTEYGLYRNYEGEWTVFFTSNYVFIADIAPDGTVLASVGDFQTGTEKLYRYDGQEWTNISISEQLDGLSMGNFATAPNGDIWASLQDVSEREFLGITRYDGESWTTFTMDDGLLGNYVDDIVIGPDGMVWVFGADQDQYRTLSRGISWYDGEKWSTQSNLPGTIAYPHRYGMEVATDGALWCGGQSGKYGKLHRFDGETWTSYGPEENAGTNDTEFTNLQIDEDGVIWTGTRGGAARFDGETWAVYTTPDQFGGSWVNCVSAAPDGSVWVGISSHGISRFDGTSWTTYTKENDGLASNSVMSIDYGADGDVWMGAYGQGLMHFDGETWSCYVPDIDVRLYVFDSVAVAPDGSVWCGHFFAPNNKTIEGVSHFDGETFTHYTVEDGLPSNDVDDVAIAPDGSIWAGTYMDGLAVYDGETWKPIEHPCEGVIIDGIARVGIKSIEFAPDGCAWVGTAGEGLCRYDGENWTVFRKEDGLLDNYIYSIAIAPDGKIWYSTDSGVGCYDGEAFTNFTTADGLASNDVRTITVDADGVVWAGTVSGLSRYVSTGLDQPTFV